MMMAPSTFLASAASTLELQQSILPEGINDLTDQSVVSVENIWTIGAGRILKVEGHSGGSN